MCGHPEEVDRLQNVCTACGRVLFYEYDLDAVRETLPRDALRARDATLWRYRELLPVRETRHIISLGEGMTPCSPRPGSVRCLAFPNSMSRMRASTQPGHSRRGGSVSP